MDAVRCPLCGKFKPTHQPICYDCAKSKLQVEEAYRRGLLEPPQHARPPLAVADRRRLLLQMPVSFYHCPNSSRVLMGADGDDKVMCGCGRTNPRLLAITPTTTEVDPVGGHAHHVKRFLDRATVDEYLAARERGEAW